MVAQTLKLHNYLCEEAAKTCWAEIQMKAYIYQLKSYLKSTDDTDGIVAMGTDGR